MSFWDLIKEQYYLLDQRRKFRKCHGYELDLKDPKSYNEKIFWRKVFDRNPVFPVLQDKFLARQFIRDSLGKETADKILVTLYCATGNPEEIPFDDLPEEYIVKPNHGSGWVKIVDTSNPAKREDIILECRKWLSKRYGERYLEWAYSQVKPMILVERLLKDGIGILPSDFKFYVFNGTVKLVYVLHGRRGRPSEAFYDRTFKRLWINSQYADGPGIIKPQGFEEMVGIAEKLAAQLDFLRVDLYNVEGNIFFGEFTLYPASGLYRYVPVDFERRLGECWNLNRIYGRPFRPWF